MHSLLLVAALAQAGEAAAGRAPFVSEEGAFAVVFPAKPEQDTLTLPSGQIRYSFHVADDEAVYFLVFTCLPAEGRSSDASQLLDDARDSGLRLTGATVMSERRLKVGRHPAADLMEQTPDGTVTYNRLVVGADGAFYSLSAVPRAPRSKKKALQFLTSFAVLPSTGRARCRQ